jgi:hypothetical protein
MDFQNVTTYIGLLSRIDGTIPACNSLLNKAQYQLYAA